MVGALLQISFQICHTHMKLMSLYQISIMSAIKCGFILEASVCMCIQCLQYLSEKLYLVHQLLTLVNKNPHTQTT